MGISSSDGNTVTCCENNSVKDQNGNELRLCSAIDEERVQADDEKKKENQTIVYICKSSVPRETSKGYRTVTTTKWACFNGKDEIINAYKKGFRETYVKYCPNVILLYKGHVNHYRDGSYKYWSDGGMSGQDICKKTSEGIALNNQKKNKKISNILLLKNKE